jgi:anti-repressor protein
VCRALGIKNDRDVSAKLDADEKVVVDMTTMTPVANTDAVNINDLRADGTNRYQTFFTEPGMYHVIRNSRKPAGKRLRRWVDHEVLPSIRRTGSYGAVREPDWLAEAKTGRSADRKGLCQRAPC